MMLFAREKSETLKRAGEVRHRIHPALQIPIFFAVLLAASQAMSVVLVPAMASWICSSLRFNGTFAYVPFLDGVTDLYEEIFNILNNFPEWMVILMLVLTIFETGAALLFCRVIEGRSFRSMGFTRKRMIPDYLLGLLVGCAMVTATIFVLQATGSVTLAWSGKTSPLIIGIFFLSFVIQGMAEEVLFRGYLEISLANRLPIPAAIAISSVVFALCHIGTLSLTLQDFLNIGLLGATLALLILKTDSIWMSCAIHTAWNFTLCCGFGTGALGGSSTPEGTLLFANSATEESAGFLLGGTIGSLDGLAETVILLVVFALVLFLPQRKARNASEK